MAAWGPGPSSIWRPRPLFRICWACPGLMGRVPWSPPAQTGLSVRHWLLPFLWTLQRHSGLVSLCDPQAGEAFLGTDLPLLKPLLAWGSLSVSGVHSSPPAPSPIPAALRVKHPLKATSPPTTPSPCHHSKLGSPALLAPGTGFVEDNYSLDWSVGGDFRVTRAHCLLCTLLLSYQIIKHQIPEVVGPCSA